MWIVSNSCLSLQPLLEQDFLQPCATQGQSEQMMEILKQRQPYLSMGFQMTTYTGITELRGNGRPQRKSLHIVYIPCGLCLCKCSPLFWKREISKFKARFQPRGAGYMAGYQGRSLCSGHKAEVQFLERGTSKASTTAGWLWFFLWAFQAARTTQTQKARGGWGRDNKCYQAQPADSTLDFSSPSNLFCGCSHSFQFWHKQNSGWKWPTCQRRKSLSLTSPEVRIKMSGWGEWLV